VFHLQGKDHKEAPEIIAGDIGAVAKIEDIHTNDVLHDDHALDSVHLKALAFPTPMYGPGDHAQGARRRARSSPPCCRKSPRKIRPSNGTPTARRTRWSSTASGSCTLRLILEKLSNRGLHVDSKPPKIAYRETIQLKAEGHHRHKKQTGGAGQFGEVFLRVEPLSDDSPHRKDKGGSGIEIVNEIFGGTIPGQFIPAVEKGIHDLLDQGVIAGYPLQDVLVAITDGKHHPVDSKEVAFRTAGKYAFRDAVMKAKPVLLEPIVNMEVTVPEDKMGTITGDLSGKRGRIQGTDILPGGMAVVKAQAPLSEVHAVSVAAQERDRRTGQLRDGIKPLRPGPAAGAAADRVALQAQGGRGIGFTNIGSNAMVASPLHAGHAGKVTLMLRTSAIVLLVLAACGVANGQNANFSNWPEGKSPKEVGDRVAKHFIESPHQNFGRAEPPKKITYPEVCTWYGALDVRQGDQQRRAESSSSSSASSRSSATRGRSFPPPPTSTRPSSPPCRSSCSFRRRTSATSRSPSRWRTLSGGSRIGRRRRSLRSRKR